MQVEAKYRLELGDITGSVQGKPIGMATQENSQNQVWGTNASHNYAIFHSRQNILFKNRKGFEKALESAIFESCLQGVSTRKIQEIVAHLGVEQISSSCVSKIASKLDESVNLFLSRPVDTVIPYLL